MPSSVECILQIHPQLQVICRASSTTSCGELDGIVIPFVAWLLPFMVLFIWSLSFDHYFQVCSTLSRLKNLFGLWKSLRLDDEGYACQIRREGVVVFMPNNCVYDGYQVQNRQKPSLASDVVEREFGRAWEATPMNLLRIAAANHCPTITSRI